MAFSLPLATGWYPTEWPHRAEGPNLYAARVLLAYLDESYSQDWYYMAALLCDGAGAQAITAALDAVVDKAIRDHGGSRRR